MGWVLFFSLSYSTTRWIRLFIWPLFFINILCLILAFLTSQQGDPKRWLDLGFFNYQPSETLKFILTLLLSTQLAKTALKSKLDFKNCFGLLILIGPPVLLVLFQPDLGTAGLILLIMAVLILFKGLKTEVLFFILVTSLISAPVFWHVLLKPYQKSRLVSFIKPGEDPKGTGYNIIQSKIAIGSGQIFGKGFKKGTQHNLEFLPERHTDFIFSVLSEEYGFLGSSLTLILFFLLLYLIFSLGSQCRDRLSAYLCVGTGAFLLWHIVLNVAMTMGIFPVVGIPLPFFSYGGSHTITLMAFLGLVASIHKQKDLF